MTALEIIEPGEWVEAISSRELAEKGKAIVKLNGKQILLWRSGDRSLCLQQQMPA